MFLLSYIQCRLSNFVLRLSKRENAELEYKRKVLNLAKGHERAREMEKVKRYYMPEDSKKNDVPDMYIEVDEKEKVPNYEQKKWEEERLNQAQMHFGAKDAEAKHRSKVSSSFFF